MTVIASGVLIYRVTASGPRLLLLKNRDNGHWGMPKGRRDPDDRHEVENALREVAEETGWQGLTLHRDFREVVEYVARGTEDDGRRKRVTYFLAPAPPGDPTLSAEHEAFLWAGRDDVSTCLPYAQLRELALHALSVVRDGALDPGPDPNAPRGP